MPNINLSRRLISLVRTTFQKCGKSESGHRRVRDFVSDVRLALEPLEDRRLLAAWYPNAVAQAAARAESPVAEYVIPDGWERMSGAERAQASIRDPRASEISLTYVTVDSPANHVVAPGTGQDGVALLSITRTDGTGTCSGTLLPDGIHVLTAAHCFTDKNGLFITNSSTVTFHLPGGNQTIATQTYSVHQDYDGNVLQGNDIAIIELASAAPAGAERFPIYRGTDEISKIGDKAGYGQSGTGTTGATLSDGTKRSGQNRYESLLDIFDGTIYGPDTVAPGAHLVYDFDNGISANDAFGWWFNVHDLGLCNSEVMTAPGDSGGPTFIDGRIAGVTSFRQGFTNESDILSGPNSSFGEFGVDMRVSTYAAWIDSVVDAPTVIAQSPVAGEVIGTTSVDVDVTFLDTVSGVDVTDLVVSGSGGGSATVNSVSSLGGNVYRFDVSGLTEGTVDLILAPDAGDIDDGAGTDLAPLPWSFTVGPPTVPDVTLSVTAPGVVSFSWPDSQGETGYEIFDWGSGSKVSVATLSANSTGTTLSNLTPGVAYDFSVEASNTFGTVASARHVTPVVGINEPIFTTDSTPELTGTVDNAAWDVRVTVNNVTYRATNNGDGTWTLADNDIGPALVDGVYNVVTTATTTLCDSAVDFTIDELTVDTVAPTVSTKTPADLATVYSSSIVVDVTFSEAVSDVIPSDLILSGTGAAAATVDGVAQVGQSNTWQFSISDLAAGTVNLSLAPVAGDITDLAGNNLANVTWSYTASAPTAAVLSLAAPLATEVELTWTDSVGESDYYIYDGAYLTTVAANSTSYTVTGLVPDTQHDFMVVAHSSLGTTNSGPYQQIDTPALEAPPFTVAAVAADSVRVDWEDSNGETSFRIYRFNYNADDTPDGNPNWEYIADWPSGVGSRSVTFSGLTPDRLVGYQVKALAPSTTAENNEETLRTPVADTPVLTLTPLTPTSVKLDWVNATGEDSYLVSVYL